MFPSKTVLHEFLLVLPYSGKIKKKSVTVSSWRVRTVSKQGPFSLKCSDLVEEISEISALRDAAQPAFQTTLRTFCALHVSTREAANSQTYIVQL